MLLQMRDNLRPPSRLPHSDVSAVFVSSVLNPILGCVGGTVHKRGTVLAAAAHSNTQRGSSSTIPNRKMTFSTQW